MRLKYEPASGPLHISVKWLLTPNLAAGDAQDGPSAPAAAEGGPAESGVPAGSGGAEGAAG